MALSRHHSALARPRSVEEIVREADSFEFNTNRPLQQWIRSAKQLLTEAALSEDDGNLQVAYLYLYRYAELVVGRFPTHPEYRDPQYKNELAQARKAVVKTLQKLEEWKPRINQEHQRYLRAMERRSAEKQRAQEQHQNDQRRRRSIDPTRRVSLESDGSPPASPTYALDLDLNENRQLALDFAQRELQRRDASRLAARKLDYVPERRSSQRREVAYDRPPRYRESYDDVRDLTEQTRKLSSGGQQSSGPPTHTFSYPSVPQKHSPYDYTHASISVSRYSLPLDTAPPARPLKEPLYSYSPPEVPNRPTWNDPTTSASRTTAPPIPGKEALDHTEPASASAPPKYTFKPSAYTEAGDPLRPMFLPAGLRIEFLTLAARNTAANLETCGILCGTLVAGALLLTHLVIPAQTSTSDTCDTTEAGDAALFDYCDAHRLLVCGWIHTHPSQSCFLSSRDLHTSAAHQVMLPEAIAVVCAPTQTPDYGVFRLTAPPGLRHVLDCRQPGLFHPHSEKNLYTDALQPGHVVEAPGMGFEVVDLR